MALNYSKWDSLTIDSDDEERAVSAPEERRDASRAEALTAEAWEEAKKKAASRDARSEAGSRSSPSPVAAGAARKASHPAAAAPPEARTSAVNDAFGFDLDGALVSLRKAEPAVCCTFLEALSKQLFNAPDKKKAAFEAGALSARASASASLWEAIRKASRSVGRRGDDDRTRLGRGTPDEREPRHPPHMLQQPALQRGRRCGGFATRRLLVSSLLRVRFQF